MKRDTGWPELKAPGGLPTVGEDRDAWARYGELLRYSFSSGFDRHNMESTKQAAKYVGYYIRDLEKVVNTRLSNLRGQAFDHLRVSSSDGSMATAAAVAFVADAEPRVIAQQVRDAIDRRRLAYAWALNSYAALQGKDDGRGSAFESAILQAGGLGSLAVAVEKWLSLGRAVGVLMGWVMESERNESRGGWATLFNLLDNNKAAIPGGVTAWNKQGT